MGRIAGMKKRAHVCVSGRVQGVFYRSVVQYEAVNHNVTGWIRNLSDGRVEAVFEGEKEEVERMVDFCWKGSRRAVVVNVEVLWESYTGEFISFEVI